jgi:prepilin-type N-terminal cleavage/methylation domain-containing protein
VRQGWRVTHRDDSGFTMVELIVAMVILVTVLLTLITVQVRALQGVALGKQRQQATAYANRAMEQMRALPYGTVTAGLNSTDLTGDPNLTGGNLVPTCGAAGISEPVVTTGSAATAPLYPHVQTIASTATVNVSYKVSSYVKLVSTTPGDTSQGYWLTAIANWPATGTCGTTKTVRSRSQLFSPSDCLATATHPFSGPCQAFYDGAAASTTAGITVSSAGAAGTTPFTNNDLTSGSVSLPSLSAAVQSEEMISARGDVRA